MSRQAPSTPLIKEERDAAESPVSDGTSRPHHGHGDFLFVEIKQLISCEFPHDHGPGRGVSARMRRSAPPGIGRTGQMVRRRPAVTDSNGIARAASYMGEARTLNPRVGVRSRAAHAEVMAIGRPRTQTWRTARRIVPSAPFPGGASRTQRGRSVAGSSPAPEAMPPRTAAAPLSYSGRPGSAPGGGSTCSYSNSGREGGLRSRLLRVRLPPSTPGISPQFTPA